MQLYYFERILDAHALYGMNAQVEEENNALIGQLRASHWKAYHVRD